MHFTYGVNEPQHFQEVNRITFFRFRNNFFALYEMNNIIRPTALLLNENRTASDEETSCIISFVRRKFFSDKEVKCASHQALVNHIKRKMDRDTSLSVPYDFSLSFSNLFHRVKCTIFVNASVLH